jgi:hypothetical protein
MAMVYRCAALLALALAVVSAAAGPDPNICHEKDMDYCLVRRGGEDGRTEGEREREREREVNVCVERDNGIEEEERERERERGRGRKNFSFLRQFL